MLLLGRHPFFSLLFVPYSPAANAIFLCNSQKSVLYYCTSHGMYYYCIMYEFQGEHARLIKIIQNSGRDKVVCDMMAGVGPFAVPLAKAGHQVYANDLNPESFRALRQNGLKNKVKGRLTCANECGREFARRLVREGKVHAGALNVAECVLCVLVWFRKFIFYFAIFVRFFFFSCRL